MSRIYTFSVCSSLMLLMQWLLCGCSVPETDFIQPVPHALEATEVMSTSFIASWNPVLGSSTYLVDISTDPQFLSYVDGYQSREVSDTHLHITGLAVEKQYYYRVRAQKGNTISGNSNVITVTTAALDAPVATAATGIKVFQFTAHWQLVDEAASYIVNVSTEPTFTSLVSGYEGVEVVTDSLIVTGLDYRQTYYYRVTARRLEKTSNYSNTIEVKPCISASCKLATIVTGFQETVSLTYDDAGNLITITNDVYSICQISYNNANVATRVDVLDGDGNLTERDSLVIDSNNLVQSIYIDNNDDGQSDAVIDYLYNNLQQIIGMRQYSDVDRVNISAYQDYQVDIYGNVLKILDANGNQTGQFRYDEKFNPKMLIPQPLRSYVMDDFSGYNFRPYLGLNNPIYAQGTFSDFGSEEEVFIYDINDRDVALARKGFYKLTYEFAGCDF
ncbi:MAG TPA: fibronectin type III domain-containing protein [Ohtaekwangia sp.]|uniref:fibronectin type III domain-containing protein n=1 Tax=Ohtaekwangia sp. TaxID=2066019 RepID=UPI002F948198